MFKIPNLLTFCFFRDVIQFSFLFFKMNHICCGTQHLANEVFSHSGSSFPVLQEVLSAIIIIKLLSCCQLPDLCSKALWLIAPQIISAMVVRNTHTQSNMNAQRHMLKTHEEFSLSVVHMSLSQTCAINTHVNVHSNKGF